METAQSSNVDPSFLKVMKDISLIEGYCEQFVQDRLSLTPDQATGHELLKNLKIPFLEMDIPKFDWQKMLEEGRKLEEHSVFHRSDDSYGWKSLCLHGVGAQKTGACRDYGFLDERSTPYKWTWVAELAPETTAYIKSLVDLDYFSELYRVRFMYLEPGGYIKFHRDRPDGQTSLGPLNMALNMPENCHWLFERWGRVPFSPGNGFAVDVSNMHGVWNESNQTRVHIIIHGRYGEEYYRSIARSFLKLKETVAAKTKSSSKPVNKAPSQQRSNKVACLLWEANQEIASPELFKKCKNITEHFIKLRANRSIVFEKGFRLSSLLNNARTQGANWAVVTTPGTLVKDQFFKKVKDLINGADPETFMFAHLLDRKDRWYGIHPQCFILDIDKWVRMGRPDIDARPEDPISIVDPERSAENVHDDYTPLYLKGTDRRSETRPKIFGWNWIDKALKAGFVVKNISDDVRSHKEYLYPEQNEEQLLQQINNIENDGYSLSDHQAHVIQYLKWESVGFKEKLFLFNTEMVRNNFVEYNLKKLDAFIGLPAGFKDIHTLFRHKFNEGCELIYFDINPATLKFKEALFNQWDGTDLPKFIGDLLEENPEIFSNQKISAPPEVRVDRWLKELEVWGGLEKFNDFFNQVKGLQKTYLNVDILSNSHEIAEQLKRFKNQHIALWYSNCFNYTPGLAKYNWDLEKITSEGVAFLNSIHRIAKENNLTVSIYGEDINEGTAFSKYGIEIRQVFS